MNYRNVSLIMGLLFCLVGLARSEDKPEDLKKLQGFWIPTSVEFDGKVQPEDSPFAKEFRLLIEGEKFIFNPNQKPKGGSEHKFTIDPKASPKTMDLTPTEGPNKGKVMKSVIYTFDGDTLKICIDLFAVSGGKEAKRPTEFKTAAKDGRILFVFKKVKE